MDTRLMKASENQHLTEWAQLVAEYRNISLSRKEWCAQHGISKRKTIPRLEQTIENEGLLCQRIC